MKTKVKYTIKKSMPTKDEWIALRKAVSWTTSDSEGFDTAIKNTAFAVVLKDNESVIAMGRVISDKSIFFFIQDVIVVPKYHNYGLGTVVMELLIEYIEENTCSNSTIGLFAVKGTEKFYNQFGFVERTKNDKGHGMVKLDKL